MKLRGGERSHVKRTTEIGGEEETGGENVNVGMKKSGRQRGAQTKASRGGDFLVANCASTLVSVIITEPGEPRY